MAPEPAISVVVDNYNQGAYLRDCIDSVLAQTLAPLEILVVDDGSTDGSRAILEDYGDAIRPILQANAGQAAALNAGVAAARGRVLCFLDADDAWLPTKLERVAEVFSRDATVLWMRHRLAAVDAKRRPLGAIVPLFSGTTRGVPRRQYAIEMRLTGPTSALALRRELAARVFPLPVEVAATPGSPPVSLRRDADLVLTARAAATGAVLLSLDEVLGEYRRHPGTVFSGAGELIPMLRRQNAVATAASACFAAGRGAAVVPSTVYKHEVVCAAAEGRPPWAAARLRPLTRGIGRCLRLLATDPALGARQLAALAFAFAAPGAWTRKLMRTNGFTETT